MGKILKFILPGRQRKQEEYERHILRLEERIAFLESKLEEKELIIAAQAKSIEQICSETINNKPEAVTGGEQTKIIGLLSVIYHYLFDKGKQPAKAEDWLNMLFSHNTLKNKNNTTLYVYEDRDRKRILHLDGQTQEDSLRLAAKWLFIKYEDHRIAEAMQLIYDKLQGENPQGIASGVQIPKMLFSGSYLIIEEIIGPDLFEFFQELDTKTISPAKEIIIEEALRKQLSDTAYIRTRDYGFDQSLIIRSNHQEKTAEVFRHAGNSLTSRELDRIGVIMSPLDSIADKPMRDGAAWNFKILENVSNYLLSEQFLRQQNPNRAEIRASLQQGVYAYDFDKLTRLTFPTDEAMHTLEWPLPKIPKETMETLEDFFVQELTRNGEDTRNYWKYRQLTGLYRHLRMWFFYEQHKETYPDKDGSFRQHHLNHAYASLCRHAFNEEPTQRNKKETIDIQVIYGLMMDACCRS